MVPIDTSGPDATVDIEEVKEEAVVETENTEQIQEQINHLKMKEKQS